MQKIIDHFKRIHPNNSLRAIITGILWDFGYYFALAPGVILALAYFFVAPGYATFFFLFLVIAANRTIYEMTQARHGVCDFQKIHSFLRDDIVPRFRLTEVSPDALLEQEEQNQIDGLRPFGFLTNLSTARIFVFSPHNPNDFLSAWKAFVPLRSGAVATSKNPVAQIKEVKDEAVNAGYVFMNAVPMRDEHYQRFKAMHELAHCSFKASRVRLVGARAAGSIIVLWYVALSLGLISVLLPFLVIYTAVRGLALIPEFGRALDERIADTVALYVMKGSNGISKIIDRHHSFLKYSKAKKGPSWLQRLERRAILKKFENARSEGADYLPPLVSYIYFAWYFWPLFIIGGALVILSLRYVEDVAVTKGYYIFLIIFGILIVHLSNALDQASFIFKKSANYIIEELRIQENSLAKDMNPSERIEEFRSHARDQSFIRLTYALTGGNNYDPLLHILNNAVSLKAFMPIFLSYRSDGWSKTMAALFTFISIFFALVGATRKLILPLIILMAVSLGITLTGLVFGYPIFWLIEIMA